MKKQYEFHGSCTEQKAREYAAANRISLEKLGQYFLEKKLAEREENIISTLPSERRKVFRRVKPAANPRITPMIAYDLETTAIKKGTPRPLYLTAFFRDESREKNQGDYLYSGPVKNTDYLGEILSTRFLLPETNGTRFVAWNGNNYDVYFIAAALLSIGGYLIRPYITKSHSLRGMRVNLIDNDEMSWEFLDACSMLGMPGKKLSWFLQTFAPDHLKLDAPDWEKETFDAKNLNHVEYANRDSIGLWHGIQAAQKITMEHFNLPLRPTIGNLGIRIFSNNIPPDTYIIEPSMTAMKIIRDHLMRGGFCHCMRKYSGPVWKYDINQAYAAAMRETDLPSGTCVRSRRFNGQQRCAMWRIRAVNTRNEIPFYCIDAATGTAFFATTEIPDAWVTSQEYRQLKKEHWAIEILDGYYWPQVFRMEEYVAKLEKLRTPAPKSALGEIIKSIGNNSFGKTVERMASMDIVMALEQPDGYSEYQMPEEEIQHLWFRFSETSQRNYHQPQIGAFITAHVRMKVRAAALLAPKHFLYADTDCVIFSCPVELDIHPTRYGAWKIEAQGEEYRIIAKKVYANYGALEKHCKGLNVRRLTDKDFEHWYDGTAPVQLMVHRQNFMECMRGADMFEERIRFGERQDNETRNRIISEKFPDYVKKKSSRQKKKSA